MTKSSETKRPRRNKAARRSRSWGCHALGSEQLESRLALAIYVNANPTTATAPGSVTVYSDGGDDVFLQQVATTSPTLLIANNSSFNPTSALFGHELKSVDDFTIANYATLYVTNGTQAATRDQLSDGYPQFGGATTHHVLSQDRVVVSAADPLTGSVTYAGESWSFQTDGATTTITGPAAAVRPIGILHASASAPGDAILNISWSASPVVAPGTAAPTVTSVTYGYRVGVATITTTTDFFIPASSPASPAFTLPVPAGAAVPLGFVSSVVPGSLRGRITVDGSSGKSVAIDFRTAGITGTLVFDGRSTYAFPSLTTSDVGTRVLSGSIDYATGVISLSTTTAAGGVGLGTPQEVGAISIDATYGAAVIPLQPNDVTFFPGQTINQEVVVDLLASGSSINIESPIANTSITATGTAVLGTGVNKGKVQAVQIANGGGVYTVAPTVTFSAPPVTTPGAPPAPPAVGATGVAILSPAGVVTGVLITNPGSGYTSAPTVTFGAPTGAPVDADVVLNASFINVDAQVAADDRFLVGAEGINEYFDDPLFWQSRTARTATTSIVVDASGTPTIAGGVLADITVTAPGKGYVRAPLVIVEPPPAGSGGRQAVAKAIWDASTQTVTGFTVIDGGFGYDSAEPPVIFIEPPYSQAQAEIIKFNAAVGAQSYELYVSDDPGTTSERGMLLESSTGSLSRNPSPQQETVDTPATTIYVQADSADVISEGTIFGTLQSYVMRSTLDRDYLAPFLLTTASTRTGVSTGTLRGANVAVTLGNDALTPQLGATAFNIVNLSTRIDSFRIKAASALQQPIPPFRDNSGAFPYDLAIDEADDIQFDGVAASSNPISIAAAGNITFASALTTDGDLSITARRSQPDRTSSFTVLAPISTRFGTISVAADDLLIANSLKVTAAAVDENRDDITLVARGGSVELRGEVSGVNNIRIDQVNGAVVGADGTRVEEIGKVFGPGRLFAERVDVSSEGSVDLRTAVTSLVGVARTGFSVSEYDDITIPALATGGSVFLSAAGRDAGPGFVNAIALKASIRNLNPLSLSVTDVTANAPNGSIDVLIDSSKAVAIGNLGNLANGTAVSMKAAGNSSIVSYGSLAAYDAPLAGAGARQVRARTTGVITAVYNARRPGVLPDRLTGVGSIRAAGTIAGFDGVGNLGIGERVLVANGVSTGGLNANGIYVVTRVGGGAGVNANWEMVRAPDADTQGECPSGTYVAVVEGSLYAGTFYQLAYDTVPTVVADRVSATELELPESFGAFLPFLTNGLAVQGAGIAAGATVAGITTTPAGITVVTLTAPGGTEPILGTGPTRATFLVPLFGRTPVAATLATLTTSLGSPSGRGLTTSLVVSTTGVTNDAAGSLGKMISLRNSVDSLGSALALYFDSRIASPILLTQELTAITTSFTIDGRSRWLNSRASLVGPGVSIDGSAITRTKTGRSVAPGSVVDGFTVAGPVTAAIRNLFVGGFRSGAAVRSVNITSEPQALSIDGVKLGLTPAGDRLANKFGVLAEGNGVVAVVGSTIANSESAGISATSPQSRVTIASSAIGTNGNANEVGVRFDAGVHRIGVEVLVAKSLPAATTFDSDVITVKLGGIVPTDLTNRLFLGQGVSGSGIPTNAKILRITTDVATSTVSIVLSAKVTRTGATTAIFGSATRNSVQYNRTGVILAGGSATVVGTNVNNNSLNGIEIVGGSHRIGNTGAGAGGKSLSSLSNAIYANGGWGIHVKNAIAAAQKIFGNFFGSAYQSSAGGLNAKGNVGQNNAPLAGYNPTYKGSAIVGLDANGNQHIKEAATARPARGQPWRPR